MTTYHKNRKTSLLIVDRLSNRTAYCSARRGLTLTEILAATFVLSFGLVAALSVLPFATHLLSRMDVADTSGACGRGALQQIRMAEWQKADVLYNWVSDDVPADPYIVDPLGDIARTGMTPIPTYPATFPFNFPIAETLRVVTLKTDVTLANPSGRPLNEVEANLHFRWNDDMIFAEDANSTRPTLISADSTKQAAGDYTWMYMVTPKIAPGVDVTRPASGIAVTDPENVLSYEVAAVVFHRRDLYFDADADPQPIRRFELTKFHNGLDGNLPIAKDFPDTINATGAYISLQTSSNNPDDIALGSIKWILLTGRSQAMHDSITVPSVPNNTGAIVAQWYRITGFDEINSILDVSGNVIGYERRVFMVGPDWKGAKDSIATQRPPVYAILCDGVVNVFQATMPK